ncbi:hypothetical protein LUZ60_015311 [Juncus effusus]|nr:hypothetical protein LUZ60_015311 [Juncus effusus]
MKPSLAGLITLLRRPMFRQAAAWTALMTAAVIISSFSPEIAFVWAISKPGSCEGEKVWVPMDGAPVCLPAKAVTRSAADMFVPPVFAALVVGGAACFVKAVSVGRNEMR